MKYIRLNKEEKQKNSNARKLMDWVKKDWYVIVLFVFALWSCAYTINNVDSYVDKCNDLWQAQYESLKDKCICPEVSNPLGYGFNISYGVD